MKNLIKISSYLLVFFIALFLGWYINQKNLIINSDTSISPFVKENSPKEKNLPLNAYTIKQLKNYQFQTSNIKITKLVKDNTNYQTFLFTYQTTGKKMSGAINIPKKNNFNDNDFPVLIMLRGYVPLEIYEPGIGTKNAAAFFAENGFITLAPDFFGYGDSDADFENSWEGRFVKPINVIELIKSIQTQKSLTIDDKQIILNSNKIGIWAHSNGGQIALSSLEVLSEAIPTTLWAPVTAPFPYSILFFTDELEDEGKASRAWLAKFEQDYDVFEFSLSQHLDKLTGPLQIHHGTADDAALLAWNKEFVEKLELENERRQKLNKEIKNNNDEDLKPEQQILEPIKYNFYTYQNANHHLQNAWGTVIQRDLQFFKEELKLNSS